MQRIGFPICILLRLVLLAEKVDTFPTLKETQSLYIFIFALTSFFYLRVSLELPYHLRTHAFSFATTAASVSRTLHIFIVIRLYSDH